MNPSTAVSDVDHAHQRKQEHEYKYIEGIPEILDEEGVNPLGNRDQGIQAIRKKGPGKKSRQ